MSPDTHFIENDYLKVFQEVTRLISSVHDAQEVMDLVVRRLPALLEVDAATIRLFDRGTNSFVLGAAWGVSDEYLSRSTIDTDEVMSALLSGRPTARKNIDVSCDHDNCAFISKEGVKSAMSLPIIYKDQITGLLRLLTKDRREFAQAEINFAMSLAEQVGLAIATCQMFQELENQVRFFSAQREISRLVNSTLNLEQILEAIVEKLPGIMGVKGCTIRLLQPATNRLELVAASGVSKKYLTRGSINREDSIFKVLKGEPVAIYDAANDPRVNYHAEIREEGIRSILAVPITNDQEIIGVLRLLSAHHRSFSANDTHFAVTVAEEGGNAIEKARLYRKISLLFNQIEEHERFLQTILDALWLELLVIGPDQRIIMVNKHFLARHGRREEEVLGQRYPSVSPWHDATGQHSPLEQVLRSCKPRTVVKQYQEADRERWFERQLAPIINGQGAVDFVIEAVHDITDQVLLEQEHSQRMKLQGVIEMAGTAAHELNTPLFAALGTAQLLRDDVADPEMSAEMDLVINNMKKMAALTREMIKVTGFSSNAYVGSTRIAALQSNAKPSTS
ncbi:GAF domain-containing protein [Desulfogranum mediterraneum]|uniref:GAF domain-containing protein n=1 Tax=Desulfogranum mediterraneum TaxID=160661 RepID=UPI0004076EEA|nr:GAF domain-containing protein [Desulfogranum mediterraneum]